MADQYPLLIQQTVAEYLCIHIDVIVYQVSGAVRVGVLFKMRVAIQPAVDDFFVGVNDGTAALKDFVRMLQRNSENPFIEDPAANRIIRTAIIDSLPHLRIMADNPADPYAGHGIDFR